MSAKDETRDIRGDACICDPFDLAALGHMSNCPLRAPNTYAAGMEAAARTRATELADRAGLDEHTAFIDDLTETMLQFSQKVASGLYEAIKHGDSEHQEWLKDAINTYAAAIREAARRGEEGE